MSLPSSQVLVQMNQKIKSIPNKHGEYKRKAHYCCFLLCYGSGLRVSEAVKFDYRLPTKKGLYRIDKPKGKKERYVYILPEIVRELKENNWQPNNTNRFNFYHFLKSVKKELGIPASVELTPHTLRRSFATFNAEAGLPLPLLSKMLGHSSVRTTALYWANTHHGGDDDDSDIFSILTGGRWLEENAEEQPKPEPVASARFSWNKLSELLPNLSPSPPRPDYSTKINQLEQQLSQIQRENNNLKTELNNLSEQNATLCQEKRQSQQDLNEKDQVIRQLNQDLANEREKTTAAESNLAQEKQINHNLTQQLQAERETNTNLTQKVNVYEQNHSNLLNAYQNATTDKELAQKQLTQLTTEIKNFARTLTQWQKLNYYQQWEKQRSETKAQILQRELPPFK